MATVNLLPNADGSVQQWTPNADVPHYTTVDDPVGSPDEDLTYVYSYGGHIEDFHHATSALLVGATITNVRVNIRAKAQLGITTKINIGIKIGIIRYGAALETFITTSYANYYKDWAKKPPLNQDWTKSDIDNLQSSLLSFQYVPGRWTRVTQVYLTVTYILPTTPVAGKGLVSWTP